MSCWRWGAAAAARPTHSMECLAELVGVPTGSLDLEVALAYLRVPGPNRKCGTPFSGWQQRLVPHIGVPDHAPLRTRRSSPQTFPSLQWHLRSGDRQAQLQLRRGGGDLAKPNKQRRSLNQISGRRLLPEWNPMETPKVLHTA